MDRSGRTGMIPARPAILRAALPAIAAVLAVIAFPAVAAGENCPRSIPYSVDYSTGAAAAYDRDLTEKIFIAHPPARIASAEQAAALNLSTAAAWKARAVDDWNTVGRESAKAQAIFDATLGPSHPYTLYIKANACEPLAHLKGDQEAERCLRNALPELRAAAGENHPWTLLLQDRLATILERLGHRDEGLALHERSLTQASANHLPSFIVAHLKINAAESMGAKDPVRARTLLLEAQGAIRSASPVDWGALSAAVNNLANLAEYEGDIREAGELRRRTLTLRREHLGDGHPLTLQAMGNLVSFYADYSTPDEELIHAARCVLQVARSDPNHSEKDFAARETQLGYALYKAKRYDEAKPLLKDARDIYAKTSGRSSPQYLSVTGTLAVIKNWSGDRRGAEILYKEALTLKQYHRSQLLDSVGERKTQTNYGLFLAQDGRATEGLALLRTAIASLPGPGLSSPDANDDEADDRRTANAYFVYAAGASPEHDPATSAALRAESFIAAQQVASIAPAAALDRAMSYRLYDQDTFRALVAEREALAKQGLELGRAQLRASAGSAASLAQDLQQLQTQAAAIAKRRGAVDEELRTRYPKYWDLMTSRPVTVSDFQETTSCDAGLLHCDEAVVQVLQTPEGLISSGEVYVFVVTREGSAWARAGMDGKALSAAVGRLRCGLDKANCRSGPGGPFTRRTAYEIYQALFGDPQVAALLASKPKLLVAANGALTALPLAVLITRPPQGPDDPAAFAGADWLIRTKTITTLPGIASLRTLRGPGSQVRPATRPFLGFAPSFDGPPGPRGAPALQVAARYFRGGQADLDSVRGLSALANAEEIRAMSRHLNGQPVVGPDASEARVYALNDQGRGPLANTRVVAFATHGLLSGQFKFLAEPALALTPPARPPANQPERDDGLLTASEIAGLHFNADWVVLSACNTGGGDSPEAEGLSGLARAFFYAGARSLLVSHWRVDDMAASFLTTRTVELAQDGQLTRAQALRQAQLQFIRGDIPAADLLPRDARQVVFADPALWAPFVVVGQ